jgi:hypothetical protein
MVMQAQIAFEAFQCSMAYLNVLLHAKRKYYDILLWLKWKS